MNRIPQGSIPLIVGPNQSTVGEVLLDAGINPLEVLVSRGGHLLSDDALVEAGEEILVIRIAHGG